MHNNGTLAGRLHAVVRRLQAAKQSEVVLEESMRRVNAITSVV